MPMSERKLEQIRKARFNLDLAINLLDKAADSLTEGKELVMIERSISDIQYAKLRLAEVNEQILIRIRKAKI